MIKKLSLSAALLLATVTVAPAAELIVFPGAVLVDEKREGFTSQRMPIGPFGLGELPSIWAEGNRNLQAWHTPETDLTTLQVIAPLRDQLIDQGYDLLFECRDIDCGGFDFRFAQDMLPEPDMHVNLADFRFLSAQRMTDDAPEYVTVFVSRNRARGYVHITTIGAERSGDVLTTVTATKGNLNPIFEIASDETIGQVLVREGVAVLEDLDFKTGSSLLATGDFASLSALANFLNTKPESKVSLVGHTDAVGSMAANFKISKARATSVRDRLINQFGVDQDQVDAQGVGYLSPVATNQSEDGRSLNRRVEVVLTSTN